MSLRSPINQCLYNALFRIGKGHITITSAGEPMVFEYHEMPDGHVVKNVISPGEYYRINCLNCNDTTRRLWVNHMFGVKDPRTGSRHRWLAHCFNENCLAEEMNRQDLIDWLGDFGASHTNIPIVQRPATEANCAAPPLPADMILLDKLPDDHIAVDYVRNRGFDPHWLANEWGIGFSFEACPWSPQGRLIIPLIKYEDGDAHHAGWQARAIEENDKPKYHTAKGTKKSHVLYGFDHVADDLPVLITEGPFDVWSAHRCGRIGISLLGKSASASQINQLVTLYENRPLIVALDNDAEGDGRDLVLLLRRSRLDKGETTPVVLAPLPAGCDIGDLDRRQIETLVTDAVSEAYGDQT